MSYDEWLEPDDQMGLWEYQSQPLTVKWLMVALGQLDIEMPAETIQSLLRALGSNAELPVEVDHYDGTANRQLRPMYIDVRAEGGRAAAVVITVH